jgi:hypothetical protein
MEVDGTMWNDLRSKMFVLAEEPPFWALISQHLTWRKRTKILSEWRRVSRWGRVAIHTWLCMFLGDCAMRCFVSASNEIYLLACVLETLWVVEVIMRTTSLEGLMCTVLWTLCVMQVVSMYLIGEV